MCSLDASRSATLGVPVEEQVARAVAEAPFGRYGEPPEFARVAAFLLSPAASYVSGAMLLVDGALVSAQP